jgi:ribosomal protein S18 acetylase RimI-like enzyme
MYSSNVSADYDTPDALPHRSSPDCGVAALELLNTAADEAETLAFLETRPVHTVNLRGLIRDNGLDSPRNRGQFYGYRDAGGRLEGVALIGHATLVETRTARALESVARKAQDCTRAHMILGEQEMVKEFWNYYAEDGRKMRLACRELLFELNWPVEVCQEVAGLRPATIDDLDLIIPVHVAMAVAENGVNPLEKDPEGFRERYARRVERGRTWILVEDGKLVFKTEVFADTPQAVYLEGIYVSPDARGKGLGLSCLSQLSRTLLRRTETVCVLVSEENARAQAFYRKAGFRFTSTYETIFLQQD